ncbi:hypothetical protein DFP98_13541 [Cohnella phaseoli]|uniref:Uncharacterized protein n=1 Tax=Cohnella phaseoli TaxID=456490 RepID=A0A3D9I829_9BACL|nr:hypothetical protein DFP98_13541 [Cohnella phaseoli]
MVIDINKFHINEMLSELCGIHFLVLVEMRKGSKFK